MFYRGLIGVNDQKKISIEAVYKTVLHSLWYFEYNSLHILHLKVVFNYLESRHKILHF